MASRFRSWIAAALLLVTGCTGAEQANPPDEQTTSQAPEQEQVPAEESYADLVEQVEPSVVTVRAGDSVGSGVVLRSDIVVSNQHVVGDQSEIVIRYADSTESPATVVATDRVTDLAVIRTERKNLPVPEYREQLPRQGDVALAIGSPLGFQNSVTAGIISGLHREIPGSASESRSLVDLIQTDAPISPGNSGGALLDTDGRVIGINEAYIPPSTGAVALGFAIPSSTVLETTDELLSEGVATHAYLGAALGRLTSSMREQLGIQAEEGVVVVDVEDGAPADSAGLRRGDVIVRFGDEKVRTVEEILTALRRSEPDQQREIEYVRNGEHQQTTVTIGARPGS